MKRLVDINELGGVWSRISCLYQLSPAWMETLMERATGTYYWQSRQMWLARVMGVLVKRSGTVAEAPPQAEDVSSGKSI